MGDNNEAINAFNGEIGKLHQVAQILGSEMEILHKNDQKRNNDMQILMQKFSVLEKEIAQVKNVAESGATRPPQEYTPQGGVYPLSK